MTGRVVALISVLALCLLADQAATAAPSARSSADRETSLTARAGAAERTVAHTDQGVLKSRIVGTTASGRNVTGSFVPLNFAKRDGRLFVRGLLEGVVHERNGKTTTFAQLRTMRVKSLNGTPARAARAPAPRATCDILNLVLAPLDLNLLGLKVHLDRVVLDVIAQSGAGNLLGNLLCAVAGLLDGGIGGALARVTNLLNRILGLLRLG
jgi:hypothetical protein